MSTKRDYYEVLGVSTNASPDDIRKAFKREALKHHPDRNPGNAAAEQLFKECNEAYQVLSDADKRSVYDRFGHAGLEGGMGAGPGGMGDVFSHMQDLFSEMFAGGGGGFGFGGQPRRGADLRVQERLTLRDAAFGCKREISIQAPALCDECKGTGAETGTKPEPCAPCRGTGQVSNARGFVMFSAPCPRCEGRGQTISKPCGACKGHGQVARPRNVTVPFPAGIDTGQRLRIQGQGMPGPGGKNPGDLYVEVDVEEDPRFERDGVDLVVRTHVSFAEAALGSEIEVPILTPDTTNATKTIRIPSGTAAGSVLSLKNEGIPRLDGRGRGSLVVIVQVDVPTTLTPRAKELLEELRAELANSANAKRKPN